MTRLKPRPGSAALRIFISVVEQIDPESMEATNEATQQEPDEEEVHTGSSDDMENAEIPLQEVQQAPDKKGVNASDNADVANAEMSLQAAQKAIGAGGIRMTDNGGSTSTLLGNLKDLSKTLKKVLDIVVEKIAVVAKVSYRSRYASSYLN